MGRRRWNKKHPDKALAQQQPRPEDIGDPPVRLLALQPSSSVVAVAIGTRVTLVNYETGDEIRLAVSQPAGSSDPAPPHSGCLRVLQFSPDGSSLLTGGDDKAARLWLTAPAAGSEATSWRCAAAWRTPKKMSAGGFSRDGADALFADKFGDVLVGRVVKDAPAAEPQLQAPGTLLGHFCSIVTGVAPSPCGRFLATSDKDYKVRISILPLDLMHGSYEIQGYCLGHQDFISCIAFAEHKQLKEGESVSVLLSGSGDGTVKMWDCASCSLLASYVAATPAAAPGAKEGPAGEASGMEEGGEASGAGDDGDDEGEGEDGEGGEEGPSGAGQGDGNGDGAGGVEPQRRSKAPPCAPVVSLAVSADGGTVAVVVEGDDAVQLLAIDWGSRSLALQQRVRWPDVRYPSQVAFGPTGQLWVVGGVPLLTAQSVHIGVAQRGPGGQYEPCTEQVLAAPVRALLEARVEEEEAKLAEGGEQLVYSKHLRKPTYDEEESQSRKRLRNDHKETQRLAALRLRQDEKAKQQGQHEQVEQPNGEDSKAAEEPAGA